MPTMTLPSQGIAPGFGQRLKEERQRLGLSQAQLGALAGIQPLTQLKYESEQSDPNVRYLSAIGSAGINLAYLLFGIQPQESLLTPAQMQRIEDKVFDCIHACAEKGGFGFFGVRRLI
ncbi:MAG: helix-turn-helix transcriptional regulator [Propionivibrio sp.]